MERRRLIGTMCAAAVMGVSAARAGGLADAGALKERILDAARQVSGQGDPDGRVQASFEPLIAELRALVAPQPPLPLRLDRVVGAWRQVWGPYDYRGGGRGVDPSLETDEIHQVVFPGGVYYNVAVLRRRGETEIALLRGVYGISRRAPETLAVRFTDYVASRGRPEGLAVWELAALAEAGRLPRPRRVVPGLVVRAVFGGGGLREVYADGTLRLTYGAFSETDRRREALYVLERVGEAGPTPPRG